MSQGVTRPSILADFVRSFFGRFGFQCGSTLRVETLDAERPATITNTYNGVPRMAEDITTLSRPVKRLDDTKPVVATENDVLIAFAELSWLAQKEDTAAKSMNAELDAVRKKYLKQFQVDSHATAAESEAAPQGLAERRCELEQAVCVWATANKTSLVTAKLKTKDFGVGTIGFKLCPQSLMPLTPPTEKDPKPLDAALQCLLQEHQIPQAVERKLKAKPEGCSRPLSDLIRVAYAWDATKITSLIKDSLIANDELKPLLIKVDRSPERVEVKLKA